MIVWVFAQKSSTEPGPHFVPEVVWNALPDEVLQFVLGNFELLSLLPLGNEWLPLFCFFVVLVVAGFEFFNDERLEILPESMHIVANLIGFFRPDNHFIQIRTVMGYYLPIG